MLPDPMGLAGQVLHGQFRVDAIVEDGKRSVLYRGHHLMLEVPIAIKCMKPPPGAAPEAFIRRFRHESRLHYKLAQGSPHIVRVLASGTAVAPTSGGLCPFMVLEWLHGRSLADDFRARRAKSMQGRSLGETVRLLDPAIEALAFAHACGIVHREVTPDNLFLADTPDGQRVKVLDFGVAKILSDKALDLPPASQSMGLSPVGSPAYAAPEQLSAGIGPVGPWTDVYAITMVLLESLRDRVVMEEGATPMPLRVIDPARRPTPRALGIAVGDAVEAVIAQALTVDPGARPQDIGLFWRMLKNAAHRDVEEESSTTRAPSPPHRDAPIASHCDGPNADAAPSQPPTTSALSAAPPTLVMSPMARSREMGPTAASERLPGYSDASSASPVDERTARMHVDDIQKLSRTDVDAEPLTVGAELFVADEATQLYSERTLAAAGLSADDMALGDAQTTMISAVAPPRPGPLPAAPSEHPDHLPPGPPVNPDHVPPGPPVKHPGHLPPGPPVKHPGHLPPGPPVKHPGHLPPGPPVKHPGHLPPGPPVKPPSKGATAASVITVPPQPMHARGSTREPGREPGVWRGASGLPSGLVVAGMLLLLGVLAAAAAYAFGLL